MRKLTLLTIALSSLFAVAAFAESSEQNSANQNVDQIEAVVDAQGTESYYPVWECRSVPRHHRNKIYFGRGYSYYDAQNQAKIACLSRHDNCDDNGCYRVQ